MSRILHPIGTLPPDSTHESVQLYQDAKSSYGSPVVVGAIEECIPCKDFEMSVVGAQYWAPRERPIPTFPKFS